MKVTQIQVQFEKRVNDGDYGSDLVQLRLSADVDDGEDADELVAALLHQVRQRVTLDLRNSVTLAVRRRMNPKPRLCAECQQILSDDDDYEHAACEEVRVARRKAEDEERRGIEELARLREESARWSARFAAERAALGPMGTDEASDEDEDDEAM